MCGARLGRTQDERTRCRKMGGEVLTIGQLQGETPIHDNFDITLGEAIDEGGDPPRLWEPGGTTPGCAFSRSLGDHAAEVGRRAGGRREGGGRGRGGDS